MKTTNLRNIIAFASLYILGICCFSLESCNDENEDIFDYPEDAIIPQGDEAKPFEAKLRPGTLSFDEKLQKYVIIPDYVTYPYECCNTIYISNMTDEYKSLEGNVLFSGTIKKLYSIARPPLYFTEGYYSIEVSELSSVETESRSLSNDSLAFYCPTPSLRLLLGFLHVALLN